MTTADLARRLQRQLLSRGFTKLPVCAGCRKETPLSQWGRSGLCKLCLASVEAAEIQCAKAALQQVEERLHEVWMAAREATDPITAERLDLEQMGLEAEDGTVVDP